MFDRYRLRQLGFVLLACLFLSGVTVFVFRQVAAHEFVNYDDTRYVSENQWVQSGVTWRGLIWAFRTTYASNWHPITWLSHMLDCELFGLKAGSHHLSGLFLHTLNTLLLFLLFRQMTGDFWNSMLLSALFGIHPLHVESVAWVAERKDLLSTLCLILTIWAYVGYTKCSTIGLYLLVCLLFGLGLMAKPMLVTLPFVLLLLDYWPLGRFRFRTLGERTFSNLYRLTIEKLPLFFFSAASCIVTLIAQQRGEAVKSLTSFPLDVRISNALVSYVTYLEKTIWPRGLAVFYPHPGNVPVWKTAGALVFLLFGSYVVLRLAKKYHYLPVGWFWYLGTLVPVIGLVQVGLQSMADRYTYIPLIGVFIIICWGVADILRGLRYRKVLLAIISSGVIIAMMISSPLQVRHWKNSITLFRHALEVTEDNYMAHLNLGVALQKTGDVDGAMFHYREALRTKPVDLKLPRAHYNLGLASAQKGSLEEAVRQFRLALNSDPSWAAAHNDLGIALARRGEMDEAIAHFREALKTSPAHIGAMRNLQRALQLQGKQEKPPSLKTPNTH